MNQEPLFEIISAGEFHAAARRQKDLVTEPRNFTTWFALPHQLGFCTVVTHDEVQETLSADQIRYRQRYPTRMVAEINGVFVCRDCFMAEADK